MGINDYTIVKPLGAGSFGTAYLATKNDSSDQVVVKEKGWTNTVWTHGVPGSAHLEPFSGSFFFFGKVFSNFFFDQHVSLVLRSPWVQKGWAYRVSVSRNKGINLTPLRIFQTCHSFAPITRVLEAQCAHTKFLYSRVITVMRTGVTMSSAWNEIYGESFVTTLKKQIIVTELNKETRDKVFEEFRLLACLKDISIVR